MRIIRQLVGGLLAALCAAQWATANEIVPPAEKSRPWTIGIAGGYVGKPYDDLDSEEERLVAPLVLYEGERFFVRGGSLGWKFSNREDLELAVVGEFRGTMGYESKNSDTLTGMDDRDPSFDGGVHMIWKPGNLGLKLTAVADLTDEHDGYEARAEVFYQERLNGWNTKLSGGIVYQSDDLLDHYFGVRPREAIPGRRAYSADEDISFRLTGVTAYTPQGSNWVFLLGARFDVFGDEVDDSPITDDDQQFMALVGVAYTFGK